MSFLFSFSMVEYKNKHNGYWNFFPIILVLLLNIVYLKVSSIVDFISVDDEPMYALNLPGSLRQVCCASS